jgi:hypothetical protein
MATASPAPLSSRQISIATPSGVVPKGAASTVPPPMVLA